MVFSIYFVFAHLLIQQILAHRLTTSSLRLRIWLVDTAALPVLMFASSSELCLWIRLTWAGRMWERWGCWCMDRWRFPSWRLFGRAIELQYFLRSCGVRHCKQWCWILFFKKVDCLTGCKMIQIIVNFVKNFAAITQELNVNFRETCDRFTVLIW
jgi:hypothetical protein